MPVIPVEKVVIVKNALGRYEVAQAKYPLHRWSGSQWVLYGGSAQISNFEGEADAKKYAEGFDFEVVPLPPPAPAREIAPGIPAFDEVRYLAARDLAEILAREVVGMTDKTRGKASEYIDAALWNFEVQKYGKKG